MITQDLTLGLEIVLQRKLSTHHVDRGAPQSPVLGRPFAIINKNVYGLVSRFANGIKFGVANSKDLCSTI